MIRKTELEKARERRAADEAEANNSRNMSCQIMFAEVLDRLLETHSEWEHEIKTGIDQARLFKLETRRTELRNAVLTAYNTFVPVKEE